MKIAVFYNVIGQAISGFLSLAVIFIIAIRFGNEMQGQFALIKSIVDFSSFVVAFGLPQGFVFAINKMGASRMYLFRWSLVYVLFISPVVYISTFIVDNVGYFGFDHSVISLLILSVAILLYTYAALTRSIYLTIDDGLRFSLLSLLPALSLFLLVLATVLTGCRDFVSLFLFVGGSIAISGYIVNKHGIGVEIRENVSKGIWKDIAKQSGFSYFILCCNAGQAILLFGMAQIIGGGLRDVGVLSIALTMYNVTNMIAGMISPVLYNRWSRQLTAASARLVVRRIAASSIIIGLAVALCSILVEPILVALGVADPDAIALAVGILALGFIPVVFSRLIVPAVLALGQPLPLAASVAIRTATIPIATLLIDSYGLSVQTACASGLVISEWIGLIAFVIIARARSRRNAFLKS